MPHRQVPLLVPCLLFPLSLCSCGPTPAQEAAMSRQGATATADLDVPPKQLVDQVRRAVSNPPVALDVEPQGKGVLLTGWKRYRGTFHIASYWQERTRWRVAVFPDFDEPATRSHLTVTAETEQRAAEGQRWDREPRVPRPRRAQDMLKSILDNLHESAGSPTTRSQ